ncbi:MAG: DUF3293 domain-containing protein [Thermoanaerobaculia bacterium]|nr:DUF3293 domain-containing protein [Thermoanaerobaculia bacterium]MBP9824596.1 DUF3293 domain-containing protein [Thermoanaerobaculia bacterium]
MCQRDRAEEDRSAHRAASTIPGELRESYTRAVYRVDCKEGPILLRVGAASAALDRWLETQRASCFAFLSAANPGSVALPETENLRRHRLLVDRLGESGLPAVAGESFDPATGGWREASLLVVGIDREAALALAREFGQAALLWGEIGRPVALLPTAGGALEPD